MICALVGLVSGVRMGEVILLGSAGSLICFENADGVQVNSELRPLWENEPLASC
jgi:hypothetical protein